MFTKVYRLQVLLWYVELEKEFVSESVLVFSNCLSANLNRNIPVTYHILLFHLPCLASFT